MKKSLFLATLGVFSLAPLALADVTWHGVEFAVAFPSGNHTTLNLVGQDKVTDYYLSGSQYVGGAKEFLGLYIGNGSGLKFNFTDTVTTKHLYIGSDVKMASTDQNETKAVNHINWSTVNGTSGNFYNGVISVSGDGAWVDIDADYAARINLSGMSNGAVYLNEKGHLTTALDSSNTVYATISADQDWTAAKHSISDGYLVSELSRTLLTGDFSSWEGSVELTGADLHATDCGAESLSITYGKTDAELYTGTSGYTHAGAAFFFDEDEGLSIDTTADLTFSNNTDTGNEDVYLSAGVIAMNGDVEISTTGSVSFTDNSTKFSGSAAGAVYSGGAVTIEAAGIELEDNHAYASAGGAISADFGNVTLTATDGGDITISGNTATGTGGAIYSAEGVIISADGAVTISDNASDDSGGAIYAYGDVEITGSTVTISGNSGDNGGAIYSEGSVTLKATGGDIKVTGNTAASSGGAIFIGGTDAVVTIAAENGNVTFSGNGDAAGANDICFYDDGTLNLSAAEGKTAALEGGVSGGDEAVAVQININSEGESGTVVLGGESNIIHHTAVSGGTLVLKDGAVLGCAPAESAYSLRAVTTFGVEGGGYTGSTFVAQNGAAVKYDGEGSAVIYAQAAEITDSTVEGVTINVEEYVEISNSTLTDTLVTGDATNATLVLGDNVTVTLTSLTETTVFDNFSEVSGTVTLDISADTIRAALDAGDTSLEINLFGDQVTIGTEGLTLKFSQTMANILFDSGADFGFGFDTGDISEVISISLIAGATSISSYVVNLENVTEIVPEPTTTTLSLLTLAALCARRRRKA